MSTFKFKNKRFTYNTVPYNNTGERAVEVPLGLSFLRTIKDKSRVCEIGNVLAIYEAELGFDTEICPRRIVDLYEKGPRIENIDVMDLPPGEKYSAIVSISTVEHVGQDWLNSEAPGMRDREGPLKAIAKIYDLLRPQGEAFITVPFGVLTDSRAQIQFSEPYLRLLTSKYGVPAKAISLGFLRRLIAIEQRWEEADIDSLDLAEYCAPMIGANAIAIIELTKLEEPFELNLHLPPTPLKYHRQIDHLRIGLVSYSRLLADTAETIKAKLAAGKDMPSILEEGYPEEWKPWLIDSSDEKRWFESVCRGVTGGWHSN
jgi:SAM-dependent methyltransferase